MTKKIYSVKSFNFDTTTELSIRNNYKDYLNWPIVYLLDNKTSKEAYIGETTDVVTRLKTHSKSEKKQNLSNVSIVLSEKFNKSATLDIESQLIRYMAADGQYSLLNGNLGISNHQYYNQKEVYQDLFTDIWDDLRSMGICRHSLEYIDNSDLFKYSPYKSLSKEQVSSLKLILECLLDGNAKTSLIQGGAGTGKSILAIFLFKLLKTDIPDFNFADFNEEDLELYNLITEVKEKYGDLKMALVIPMSSFRKTISNVFKNIKGLSHKMVVGPSEIVKEKYDLLIVDEAHRLRRRVNLGSYYKTFDDNCIKLGLNKETASEVDWIELQSAKNILFYDFNQSIKPSDATIETFNRLGQKSSTRKEFLQTQFRVKGGNEYVNLVHLLFDPSISTPSTKLVISDYEVFIFDDLQLMLDRIQTKEQLDGLSRLVAGYAWEWASKNNPNAFDIEINDVKLKWNSTAIDWVNSKNAINEVGCIHTTQGYDLNYTGVIIGPELDFDFEINQLIVDKSKYKDKNGKNSISDPEALLDYVINIYKTILLRGIKGTYIYVCNDNLRKYLTQYINIFSSNDSVKTFKISDSETDNSIPYYDLSIAAGLFSEHQQVEKVRYIEIDGINHKDDYFACKVVGESMNKIIPNGSICLFKKYNGGSRNGLITLVEGNDIFDSDYGSKYTIKEYLSKKSIDNDEWQHQEIHLIPKSYDQSYKTIILQDDQIDNFKVIAEFIKVL